MVRLNIPVIIKELCVLLVHSQLSLSRSQQQQQNSGGVEEEGKKEGKKKFEVNEANRSESREKV